MVGDRTCFLVVGKGVSKPQRFVASVRTADSGEIAIFARWDARGNPVKVGTSRLTIWLLGPCLMLVLLCLPCVQHKYRDRICCFPLLEREATTPKSVVASFPRHGRIIRLVRYLTNSLTFSAWPERVCLVPLFIPRRIRFAFWRPTLFFSRRCCLVMCRSFGMRK